MIIIVDTSVWIDFFADRDSPETNSLKGYLQDDVTEVAITDLILCEILQGIKSPSQEKEIREKLLVLPVFSTGGVELAIAAAANYRKLRKKGITVRSTIDCLLATYAIENKYCFLHNDRDFGPFEKHLGLKVVKLKKNE
jgi:hypothetical protein